MDDSGHNRKQEKKKSAELSSKGLEVHWVKKKPFEIQTYGLRKTLNES